MDRIVMGIPTLAWKTHALRDFDYYHGCQDHFIKTIPINHQDLSFLL